MSDSIDRQKLREDMYHEAFEVDSDLQKWDGGCWIRYKMFENIIDKQPSVQPEIIRCKDCKFHGYNECFHQLGLMTAFDNNFCSYAERKEQDDG